MSEIGWVGAGIAYNTVVGDNLVDAKLMYNRGIFEGSLSMRNLFDTDYVASGENWGDGDVYLSPGDPLTVYGEVALSLQ